jgi:hypothetical protein
MDGQGSGDEPLTLAFKNQKVVMGFGVRRGRSCGCGALNVGAYAEQEHNKVYRIAIVHALTCSDVTGESRTLGH